MSTENDNRPDDRAEGGDHLPSETRRDPTTNGKLPKMAVVPFELISNRRLKPSTFRVVVMLLAHRERRPDHPNFDWAFPSQRTLAAELGLSESTARYHLAQLAVLGLIEIHPRTDLDPEFRGHRRARAYRFIDPPSDDGLERISSLFGLLDVSAFPTVRMSPTAISVTDDPSPARGSTVMGIAVELSQASRRTDSLNRPEEQTTEQTVFEDSRSHAENAASASRLPSDRQVDSPGGEGMKIPDEVLQAWQSWRGEPPSKGALSTLAYYVAQCGEATVIQQIRQAQTEDLPDAGALWIDLSRSIAFREQAETPSVP